MRLVSDDIVDILGGANIGILGQNLFVAPPIPSKPDFCVTVWDTGSTNEPDPNYLDYRYPTFQVRIRSKKENRRLAIESCNNVREYLHYWQGAIEQRRYLYILVLTEPQYIGYDELSRSIFSMNFRAQYAPYVTKLMESNNEYI